MKIIFIGNVEFSYEILKILISKKFNIIGIISDKNKKINSDFKSLKTLAVKYLIPSFLTNDINDIQSYNWIKKKHPDLIICCGWSRIIKKKILSIPPLGVIGYHPAELPKNRGRHPLIWALVLGLKKTASTFFFINEEIDDGKIIKQKIISINNYDDARSLYSKITKIAKVQIVKILFEMSEAKLKLKRKIRTNLKTNFWRKRNYEDGKIDWKMSSYSIYNLIRGLTKPYVGAHITIKGKEYKIWKANKCTTKNSNNIEPGKVIKVYKDKTFLIKCGEGCLKILNISPIPKISRGDYLK